MAINSDFSGGGGTGTNWQPLAIKYKDKRLPWILAGPILRKVTTRSVTVWLALSVCASVTLTVKGKDGSTLVGTVGNPQIAAGPKLFIVIVTATGGTLPAGQVADYDLSFTAVAGGATDTKSLKEALCEGDYTIDIGLTGGGPTLVPPPDDLASVRIAHGSCRRPNGQMVDAMGQLEELLRDTANRPQILALTGDQIYADSSGIPFLFQTLECADLLLGWRDKITIPTNVGFLSEHDTFPGLREGLAKAAGFVQSYPPHAHLMRFCEYLFAHILGWSDVLWPENLPTCVEMLTAELLKLYPDDDDDLIDSKLSDLYSIDLETQYSTDKLRLEQFRATLKSVRRSLANVATYMMWDDHDITDDWLLSRDWSATVLKSTTGRDTLRNGMCAFFVCQAVGNNPEEFLSVGGPNVHIFPLIQDWLDNQPDGEDGDAAATSIETLLGFPSSGTPSGAPVCQVKVHFRIVFPAFELIGLDPRGHRAHPSKGSLRLGAPLLIDPDDSLVQQLPDDHEAPDLAVVISPAPVFGLTIMDFLQRLMLDKGIALAGFGQSVATALLYRDAEAWSLQETARQALLARLAARTGRDVSRVVLLSGDVHVGFTFQVELVGQPLYREGGKKRLLIAQLTSSALHNETDLLERDTASGHLGFTLGMPNESTELLHHAGYTYESKRQYAVGKTNAPGWIPSQGWEKATPATGGNDVGIPTVRKARLGLNLLENLPNPVAGVSPTASAWWIQTRILDPAFKEPVNTPALIGTTSITGKLAEYLWLDIPNGFSSEWGWRLDQRQGVLWGRGLTTAGVWVPSEAGAQLIGALEGGASELRSLLGIPNEDLFSKVSGTEVVGTNNIGLVTFQISGANLSVRHALFHGMTDKGSASRQTVWDVTMNASNLSIADIESGVKQ